MLRDLSALPPPPPPPILLPHILLRLFHRSATVAPLSNNLTKTLTFYPLSKISPMFFPTYFTMRVISTPLHQAPPPAPLNI